MMRQIEDAQSAPRTLACFLKQLNILSSNGARSPQLKASIPHPVRLMSQALLVTILTLSSMGCSRHQESKEAMFWHWFQANESRLFDFEKDQEKIFHELGTQLHSVRAELTFEFGPQHDGKREFVISADGIKDAFPAVIALADAAPPLSRWKITKFRPRRGFQGPVTISGFRIAPDQLRFTIQPDGDKVGLTLFIQGYDPAEHEKFASVVYLMLDQALGEYDVETKVGFIELESASAPSELVKQPFSSLAEGVDSWLKSNSKK